MNSENSLIALLLVYIEYFDSMPAENIFQDCDNKYIFSVMQKQKNYSYVTLREKIDEIEILTKLEYLYNLHFEVNDFSAYLDAVLLEYIKRRTADYARKLETGNYNNIDDAKYDYNEISALFERTSAESISHVREIIRQIAKEEQAGIIIQTVDSYISYIDNQTKLAPDMFVVVGARPSVGKTSLLLNIIARDIKYKIPVLLFSLETNKVAITRSLACILAGVDQLDYKNGILSNQDKIAIHEAYDMIYESQLYIDDSPRIDISQIERKTRMQKKEHGIKKMYLDYLQYVNNSNSRCGTMREQVSDISKRLKGIARENMIPLIAAAQLNRTFAGGDDKEPEISHLKESGGIEQDADIIILLHEIKRDLGNSQLMMKYGKYRDGAQGKVYTSFNKKNKRININAE